MNQAPFRNYPVMLKLICALWVLAPIAAYSQPGCPPNGWGSEVLVFYITNSAPTAPFPTNDTARLTTNRCVFHEWAWEAFAWAVAITTNQEPRFLSLHTPNELSSSIALGRRNNHHLLKLRNLKPIGGGETPEEINQAGTGGVLADQTGQPVFYSVHMNDSYFNFANQYYGLSNYAKAPNDAKFPVGSAVFKASWLVVTNLVKGYTMQAWVPYLANGTNGPIVCSSNRLVTVELTGLHVVGVTVDHPEFLWSTFELTNNAPNLQPISTNLPVSILNSTFYKAYTPASACNQLTQLSVDFPTQTLSPIPNVYRQYIYGGGSGDDAADISNINADAQPAMASQSKQKVFANYRLIGTAWQNANTLKPGVTNMSQQVVGCTNLANSTLETYTQGPEHTGGQNANCFYCHNTGAVPPYAGKNINLSHTLLAPLFSNSSSSRAKK